jgi:NDP-sugar pyrophosphorylase family protein
MGEGEGVAMQAVILAGGKGTRLRPLTLKTPKPMVPVCGKPFLGYLLELLRDSGIKDVLLLVGYMAKTIEQYFQTGSGLGLRIDYSYEAEPLGTAGALKNAEDRLQGAFLLLNGDTFWPFPYMALAEHFRRTEKPGVMVAYSNAEGIAPNNVLLGQQGLVAVYDKRDPLGMTHLDAGVLVLDRKVLGLIPRGRFCSLEAEVFHELIKRQWLAAFETGQRFYDIGSFRGLSLFEEAVK